MTQRESVTHFYSLKMFFHFWWQFFKFLYSARPNNLLQCLCLTFSLYPWPCQSLGQRICWDLSLRGIRKFTGNMLPSTLQFLQNTLSLFFFFFFKAWTFFTWVTSDPDCVVSKHNISNTFIVLPCYIFRLSVFLESWGKCDLIIYNLICFLLYNID